MLCWICTIINVATSPSDVVAEQNPQTSSSSCRVLTRFCFFFYRNLSSETEDSKVNEGSQERRQEEEEN